MCIYICIYTYIHNLTIIYILQICIRIHIHIPTNSMYIFYKYMYFTNIYILQIYIYFTYIYIHTHTHTHIYIYILFFFLLCPRHVEVPRPGTEFDSSDNTESLTTRPPGNSPTVDYCLLCQRLIVRSCVGLFLVNFSFLNFHMK